MNWTWRDSTQPRHSDFFTVRNASTCKHAFPVFKCRVPMLAPSRSTFHFQNVWWVVRAKYIVVPIQARHYLNHIRHLQVRINNFYNSLYIYVIKIITTFFRAIYSASPYTRSWNLCILAVRVQRRSLVRCEAFPKDEKYFSPSSNLRSFRIWNLYWAWFIIAY